MNHFYTYLLFLLFITSSFAQTKMKITFKDGTVKTGIYKLKTMSFGFASRGKITSKKTNENYSFDDVEKFMMYQDLDSIELVVIPTKKYLKSKKTINRIGQLAFKGSKIEVYYVAEIIHQGGSTGFISSGSYFEKYVKRSVDDTAYNMGYIYGAGQRGIKKRVRDLFVDCPKLIENVNKNIISKDETLKIALFYESNCKN